MGSAFVDHGWIGWNSVGGDCCGNMDGAAMIEFTVIAFMIGQVVARVVFKYHTDLISDRFWQ
jgi:hypothetical protein